MSSCGRPKKNIFLSFNFYFYKIEEKKWTVTRHNILFFKKAILGGMMEEEEGKKLGGGAFNIYIYFSAKLYNNCSM